MWIEVIDNITKFIDGRALVKNKKTGQQIQVSDGKQIIVEKDRILGLEIMDKKYDEAKKYRINYVHLVALKCIKMFQKKHMLYMMHIYQQCNL